MSAIEISGLSKIYATGFWRTGAKVALHPLHLSVEEGEIFGFLGPNGAGKTTTLKLLMGLVPPTSGAARILGMDLDDARMKAQIGFLPEQPYFYEYLTARELLLYYGRLSGMAEPELSERVEGALARVGLESPIHIQLRKFSKGMLQRIGIAQAILHDPKVVFLDEPMSGLDPMGRRDVRTLIEELKASGKTVFFSTHILSDAEALCDRVAILHQGQLRGVGTVGELSTGKQDKVEIVWKGTLTPGSVNSLLQEVRQSGSLTRAVLPTSALDRVIDGLRTGGVEIVSITPLRTSLEDYFLSQVRSPQPAEATR